MRKGKTGFTLLELLVASLLLSMLLTILTMMFNQTSMAWRTGRAGVADLDQSRQLLSEYQVMMDNAIPKLNGNGSYYVVTSPWGRDGEIAKRGYENISDSVGGTRLFVSVAGTPPVAWNDENRLGSVVSVQGGGSSAQSGFIVGVTSAGPDKVFGTSDDITTLPEGVK